MSTSEQNPAYWYINQGGHQHGPYSTTDFQNLLQQGKLAPADLVWRSGFDAWVSAKDVMPPPVVTTAVLTQSSATNIEPRSGEIQPRTATAAPRSQQQQRSNEKAQKIDQYIAVHRKSHGIAIILAILFGPFGLFYVGVGIGLLATAMEIAMLAAAQPGSISGLASRFIIVNVLLATFGAYRRNKKTTAHAVLIGA